MSSKLPFILLIAISSWAFTVNSSSSSSSSSCNATTATNANSIFTDSCNFGSSNSPPTKSPHTDLCTFSTSYLSRRLTTSSTRAEYVRGMLRNSWQAFRGSRVIWSRFKQHGGSIRLCPLRAEGVCPSSPVRLHPDSPKYTLWAPPESADLVHQALVTFWIAEMTAEFQEAQDFIFAYGDTNNLFNFAPLMAMYGLTRDRVYLERALFIVDQYFKCDNRTQFINQVQEYVVELNYFAQAAVEEGFKPQEYLDQLSRLYQNISWANSEMVSPSRKRGNNQNRIENSMNSHDYNGFHFQNRGNHYNKVKSTGGKRKIKWSKFWNQVALYRQSINIFGSGMRDFCEQIAHTIIHDRSSNDYAGTDRASVPTMWPVEGSGELFLVSSSLFNPMSGADCAWGGLLTMAADMKWNAETLYKVQLDESLPVDKLYSVGGQLVHSCFLVSTQNPDRNLRLPSKEIFLRKHPETGHYHLHDGHEHFHREEPESYLQGEGGFHLDDSELLLTYLHMARIGDRFRNQKTSHWQEAAFIVLTEIEEHLRVKINYLVKDNGKRMEGYAYHGINYLSGLERHWAESVGRELLDDRMPPEWFGQTLRYLYLIFADPIKVLPFNQFVITSQGNPIPIWRQNQK